MHWTQKLKARNAYLARQNEALRNQKGTKPPAEVCQRLVHIVEKTGINRHRFNLHSDLESVIN